MADSLILEGTCYVDRLTDAGVETGIVQFGNTVKLSIKPDAERKQQMSKMKGKYGQVISSISLPKPATFSMQVDQLQRDVFAMAFFGTDSDIDVTGSSVTDEVISEAPAGGRGFLVAQRQISSVVVKDDSGTTTYVADTDYEVTSADLGLITVIDGGAIVEDQILKVSYSYASRAGYKVEGMTKVSVLVKIVLDGINLDNGNHCILTIDKGRLTPTAEIDFMSSEFFSATFDGDTETIEGASSPFRVEYYA